ncbi:MAG: imidazole glycerol phosphate synthase subunit HisH [Acidobacteriaceae bacterium]|nr:imidazole glycerol phosphate synthase subunit HisH [Acidobacteriaceae bacterium]
MTTVVDYGAGNLRSVANTLSQLQSEYVITSDPAVVAKAVKLILPGVGHFGQMMDAIDRLHLRDALLERIRAGIPFLGICVGLQCLFEGSEEAPGALGLKLFPGTVRRFSGAHRIPHMGWNSLARVKPARLLAHLEPQPFTYFAHSYYAPIVEATAATCMYAHPYTALLEHGNVYAVQFHPEKSGPVGLRVMQNFLAI